MIAVAELLATLAQILVDVSVLAIELASRPLHFVASGAYRQKVRQRWEGRPWRCGWEVFGGSLALLLFVGVFALWLRVIGASSNPPDRRQHPSFRQRLAEKILARRPAGERRRDEQAATSPHLPNTAPERTPTGGNVGPASSVRPRQ